MARSPRELPLRRRRADREPAPLTFGRGGPVDVALGEGPAVLVTYVPDVRELQGMIAGWRVMPRLRWEEFSARTRRLGSLATLCGRPQLDEQPEGTCLIGPGVEERITLVLWVSPPVVAMEMPFDGVRKLAKRAPIYGPGGALLL